jgi:hypothetical protein
MAEIRKAEALRVSDPARVVAEAMGAFREKPSEQDFGALFGEGVPYMENVERIGAPAPANGGDGQSKPMSTQSLGRVSRSGPCAPDPDLVSFICLWP